MKRREFITLTRRCGGVVDCGARTASRGAGDWVPSSDYA